MKPETHTQHLLMNNGDGKSIQHSFKGEFALLTMKVMILNSIMYHEQMVFACVAELSQQHLLYDGSQPGIHLLLLAIKSFRICDSVCYITAVFKVYSVLMPNICESTAFFLTERKQPPRVTTAFLFDYMRLHCTL